jgi:hypothetical protein
MAMTGFVCQECHDGNGDLLGDVDSRVHSNPGWVFRTMAPGPPDDREFVSVAVDAEAMSEPDKWVTRVHVRRIR